MKALVGVFLALVASGWPSGALADPGPWSSGTANPVAEGRWEVGLFAPLRWGVTPDLELRAQPLLFFVSPHIEAKWRIHRVGRFVFGLEGEVSYPTPLLSLMSREGALGLLPHDTDVPHAILFDLDGLVTAELGHQQALTLQVGASTAPRARSDRFPLLDFPFLYPRYAALYSTATARVGLRGEGPIIAGLWYAAWLEAHVLPVTAGGYAIEQGAELRYLFSESAAVSLGYLVSVARYPVGTRLHVLPLLDVELAF